MQNLINKFLQIIPIKSFQDNYSYLILGSIKNRGVLVDPADMNAIIPFLQRYNNLTISHVLYTHKHWDHAGNCQELKEFLEGYNKEKNDQKIEFIAQKEDAEQIPVTTKVIEKKQDQIEVNNVKFQTYHAPCHTTGHVLYYFECDEKFQNQLSQEDQKILDENKSFNSQKGLFTGDTLFLGGAGRFFEGNAEQMLGNMDYIGNLPEETDIFCGHEYTMQNYNWAKNVELENQTLQKYVKDAQKRLDEETMTIPCTVKLQKETNVFMRARVQSLQKLVGQENNPEGTMHALREMKNANLTIDGFRQQQQL